MVFEGATLFNNGLMVSSLQKGLTAAAAAVVAAVLPRPVFDTAPVDITPTALVEKTEVDVAGGTHTNPVRG